MELLSKILHRKLNSIDQAFDPEDPFVLVRLKVADLKGAFYIAHYHAKSESVSGPYVGLDGDPSAIGIGVFTLDELDEPIKNK